MADVERFVTDLVTHYPALAACAQDVMRAYELLEGVFTGGGKLLTCGNGGSGAVSRWPLQVTHHPLPPRNPAGTRRRSRLVA